MTLILPTRRTMASGLGTLCRLAVMFALSLPATGCLYGETINEINTDPAPPQFEPGNPNPQGAATAGNPEGTPFTMHTDSTDAQQFTATAYDPGNPGDANELTYTWTLDAVTTVQAAKTGLSGSFFLANASAIGETGTTHYLTVQITSPTGSLTATWTINLVN